jgi:hypothetical protein
MLRSGLFLVLGSSPYSQRVGRSTKPRRTRRFYLT